MENKELKKPIPVALEDEALDTVSGGTEPFAPNKQKMKFEIQPEDIEEAEKGSN